MPSDEAGADLAKEVGSRPRHRTITVESIAIEVLLGFSHTHGHNLESFFYLLLRLCARRGWKGSPSKDSALTKWYSGTFGGIANAKLGHMTKERGLYLSCVELYGISSFLMGMGSYLQGP